jgi:CBS domain containing-hemolysin-like protein
VLGLVVTLFFIALNGFFVAAEFALVKVSATSLGARAKRGDKRAVAAEAVVSRLNRYLSATQLGITLASLGLGWLGEPAIEALVDDATIRALGHEPGALLHGVIVAISFAILTFGHVLFGELVPKLVAIQRSEQTAMAVALPLQITYITFKPLLFILEKSTGVLLRSMGLKPDTTSEGALSEEEILGILVANAAKTATGKGKSELLERVVRFAERTARNAMVPRVDVSALPIGTSGEEAWQRLKVAQYSRILLTKEKSLDEVAGYLYGKDLLLEDGARTLKDLTTLQRDVLFVPETQSLLEVLRSMQRTQTPIAVVVDEYGGTSGIVTMEDLLEEIVGEIRDEFDEEPANIVAVQNQEGVWDVDARTAMEDLRSLGISVLPAHAAEAVGTVVLSALGRLPRRADRVDITIDATAEVTALSRRRVTSVRIRKKSPPDTNAKR